ncbi:TonB-dependent receptor plug domain-containing protein [Methylocystis hirsuta]|uniref:TonB-dependent receptor n=1 Tax=Methylocystis hirsuta TaxID=369798 RepID=A0A3M9XL50_9HYPH|nr:TonB-dependent receptor [Methylocystis hirsuta]RNJ48516.1 TonB-dependent receptor [Methylocystis hirsuta]
MPSHISTTALRGAFALSLSLSASAAFAQQSLPVIEVGPLSPAQPGSPGEALEDQTVVTPTRVEQPLSSTGASVSVIHARDIQKRGSLGFNDVLRGVPGLDVYSNGGPGTQTSVALRGSTPGQTLVLIDGVRIGDPTSTDGSVDFGRLLPTDIERIEVLRGPQSALYGSDAMGGVINIITRRGKGAPQGWLMSEGGSYGTSSSRASISGADGQGSYALSISGLHADGFPRYGYRQQRPIVIGDQTTPLPPLPANDPTNNVGVTGRIGYDFTEDARIEAGLAGYDSAIRYDNPYAFNPWSVFDPFNHQHATFMQGYVRLGADMFDKILRNRLTLYANRGNRDAWSTEACFDTLTFLSRNCRFGFLGGRRGVEYQSDVALGPLGLATIGSRVETETAQNSREAWIVDDYAPTHAVQTTWSGYAQHQFTLFDRLDISYGGRADAVSKNQTFLTWRTMANFRIDEIGMRLRGSAATGAKTASLYQRFSQYGDPTLAPERVIGFDAGIDQSFFGGFATASVSVFHNRYENLVQFGKAESCTATQIFGCYFNVGRADTRGVEFSGEAALVPGALLLRGSYTFLSARNLDVDEDSIYAGRTLLRRPRHKGMWSVIYTGAPGLELEARANIVGAAHDVDFIFNKRVMLAPYVRLDLFANYKLTDSLTLQGRIENVGNALYEEVYNYSTTARAFYGGVKYAW